MTSLSPLDAAHRALGAKMTPFGGWDMPLSYEAGTLVCDLQPDGEICMDGSQEPGIGGRHARLQYSTIATS